MVSAEVSVEVSKDVSSDASFDVDESDSTVVSLVVSAVVPVDEASELPLQDESTTVKSITKTNNNDKNLVLFMFFSLKQNYLKNHNTEQFLCK